MEKWQTFSLDAIKARAKNVVEILNLMLTKEILDNMKNRTKYKSIHNSPLSKIDKEARD